MKLEAGFYWVKHNRRGWMVCFWNNTAWMETGSKFSLPPHSIIRINEERILPPQN